MSTKAQGKAIDHNALIATIAKGWKVVNTPKVRAGYKPGQQKLVQADGKTLGSSRCARRVSASKGQDCNAT